MDAKRLGLLLAALFVLPCDWAVAADEPQEVSVALHVQSQWIRLAPTPEEPKPPSPTRTLSALRVVRAVDPETKQPYDPSNEALGCDPADLRRAFRLEQKQFLLGEPIVVEFRVALEGPGEWREPIGGNYRARGRDDNFLFLMRHEDGTWVADTYAPAEGYEGGGMASYLPVAQGKPASSWQPVQRWCAVERPGTYDLYCFQAAHGYEVVGEHEALAAAMPDEVKQDHRLDADGVLIDLDTGKRSTRYALVANVMQEDRAPSPLLDEIPADVIEHAGKTWNVKDTADFAHFRIVITQGTDAERQEMVTRWGKIIVEAGTGNDRSGRERTRALRQAIQFARQDDFLPLIAVWIAGDRDKDWNNSTGLAMRPSREATELLLKCEPGDVLNGAYYLRQDKVAELIPHLIEWLAHDDAEVRCRAEWYLGKWTGQAFQHTWDDADRTHPTLDEGKAMQPAWRAWWDENKAGFTPVSR
jgi:hypothetical protein